MDLASARALAKIFASDFISRPDIKAIQGSDGEYKPDRDKNAAGEVVASRGFTMADLVAHLMGEQTYGHYMVAQDDTVKLFVLDIDLRKTGRLPMGKFGDQLISWEETNPREYWMSRRPGHARDMLKMQMKLIGQTLARIVQKELDIRTNVAYSGSKGIHVYGFTGKTTAERARKGAHIVLEAAGWELYRGNNFYQFKPSAPDLKDDVHNFHQFDLEVYPKQDSIQGKDLGNLVRLPLGVNRKSPKDRAFFLDMRTELTHFGPREPIEALTTSDIWADS